jgi:glycosyltransferase 2 family protein
LAIKWDSRWLRGVGILLSIASIWFLARTAATHWDTLASVSLSWGDWVFFVVAGVLYGLMLSLHGIAWGYCIAAFGVAVPLHHATGATMMAQIGRYLPGGIMHFLGRHYLLVKRGVGHRVLATSSLVDIALMCTMSVVVGLILGVLTYPTDLFLSHWAWLQAHFQTPLWIIASALVILISVGLFLAPTVLGWLQRTLAFELRLLYPSSVSYFLFFVCQAVLFLAVYQVFLADAPTALASVFTFSWLIGVLAVGAPGGIGVREASMILLGSSLAPESSILLAAVLYRAITVLGDLIAYGIGYWLLRRAPSADQERRR